ncbi:MAG: hypothetical protein ACE5JO_09720, partial [Candidatus Binatia bacterium]
MAPEKKSLIDRLIEGYERAKKPIAYAVMILGVLLGTLPSELLPQQLRSITYTAVLLVLALILMEILFELYERIVTERKEVNLINSNQLYSEILGIVANERKVNIKYLALAGRFGWQNVLEKLLNENEPNSLIAKRIQFTIEVALLDPKRCKSDAIFERFDTVESTAPSISRAAELIPKISTADSSLQVYFYDHMPNMLGFLVNDNYLFLTYSYWEYVRGDLVLRAGGSDYFVYNKSDDFGGQEFIRRFTGWFDFIRTTGSSPPTTSSSVDSVGTPAA